MPRPARILMLLDRLRGGAEASIEHLAAELGVSGRTIQRDLATLRERGEPVSGQAGPGGGVRLERTRGVVAVHMSLDEILALWLACRLSREASVLPWSGAATSALNKLLASIPGDRAASLRALLGRVYLGAPASPQLARGAGPTDVELLSLFEEAFTGGLGLGFCYTDAQGKSGWRRAEPHGLLMEPPVWYLLARDVDKGEPRTFRMDRIAQPQLDPALRFRPSDRIALQQLPPTGRYVRADSGRPVAPMKVER
jgi:predicted DNA-binding transcriptional regulator YafY